MAPILIHTQARTSSVPVTIDLPYETETEYEIIIESSDQPVD